MRGAAMRLYNAALRLVMRPIASFGRSGKNDRAWARRYGALRLHVAAVTRSGRVSRMRVSALALASDGPRGASWGRSFRVRPPNAACAGRRCNSMRGCAHTFGGGAIRSAGSTWSASVQFARPRSAGVGAAGLEAVDRQRIQVGTCRSRRSPASILSRSSAGSYARASPDGRAQPAGGRYVGTGRQRRSAVPPDSPKRARNRFASMHNSGQRDGRLRSTREPCLWWSRPVHTCLPDCERKTFSSMAC